METAKHNYTLHSEEITSEGEIHLFSSATPNEAFCSFYQEPLDEDVRDQARELINRWNNYEALQDELKKREKYKYTSEDLQHNIELAMEFGFKQHEKGHNLEMAFIELHKTLKPL